MPLNRLAVPLLGLPRPVKRLLVVTLDVSLVLISVWVAFYLRLDQTGWPQAQQGYVYLLAPALTVFLFTRFGMYRAIFRYTGIAALLGLARVVAAYGALFFAALLLLTWEGVPRSLGLIQPLLFLILVGASRALARFWLTGRMGARPGLTQGRLLIYGAGEAGVQTAFALASSRQFVVLGFVDDDRTKIGGRINGLNVIGPHSVAQTVQRLGVTDILLAMPTLARSQRNEIIAKLRDCPVHVRTLPGMADLASGKVTVQDFQELDVEDLLGRPPVAPNPVLLARDLADKTVLVTGAGGSIGGELCRQIIFERPSRLVLLDHNEFGLYSIHRELQALCTEHSLPAALFPVLASVANLTRLQEVCAFYKPATVYHAAAYKHVPLVEDNPAEGVLNNVFGTLNMARAAMQTKVGNFVLVSTDKAVRPTNVMGASKRMAELVLQALAAEASLEFNALDGVVSPAVLNQTIFTMVRFGNVLGSSGSVVPLFRKQLRAGGPLTVTHADVTRYFMTIPEAAQLVLQAGAMAQGGEVFVLDMGSPVKIMDLARRMVQLSGLTVCDETHSEGDIEIKTIGLRPGEKLYEELLIGDNPQATEHPRIMRAQEECLRWAELSPLLLAMRQAAVVNDAASLQNMLQQLVHGYSPDT